MPSVEIVMSRLPMASRLALAEFGEILAIGGLPEERLETLKAEVGDGRDVLRPPVPSVALIMVPMRMDFAGSDKLVSYAVMLTRWWSAGAFDRAEHHAEALDVVGAGGLGRAAGLDGIEELGDDAGVAVGLGRMWRGSDRHILERPQEAAIPGDDFDLELIRAIPEQRALGADHAPLRFPSWWSRPRQPRSRDR